MIREEMQREVLDTYNIIKSSGSFKLISKLQKEFAGMIWELLGKFFWKTKGNEGNPKPINMEDVD